MLFVLWNPIPLAVLFFFSERECEHPLKTTTNPKTPVCKNLFINNTEEF